MYDKKEELYGKDREKNYLRPNVKVLNQLYRKRDTREKTFLTRKKENKERRMGIIVYVFIIVNKVMSRQCTKLEAEFSLII